ncbi:uncharacterized protein [Montipora capricornis]|uniref:uncharacterized protein n=1 Tax=Montipora capricornis TaxID=246305 RepID=UPI0035F1C19A
MYADIGTNGKLSDGGVWNKCSLSQAMEDGRISLPPPKCLPHGVQKLPHIFVADDAFALRANLMKLYPQKGLDAEKRVYSYRHSQARRMVENLFGIVANRWRVFRGIIQLAPSSIESLFIAAIILYNFLRKTSSCPSGLLDTELSNGERAERLWRQEFPGNSFLPLAVPTTGHNASKDAKLVIDTS